MVMVVALLMFQNPLFKKFQFLWWARQAILVLVMRPSYQEGQGMSIFYSVCTSGLYPEQTGQGLGLDPLSFLTVNIEKGA